MQNVYVVGCPLMWIFISLAEQDGLQTLMQVTKSSELERLTCAAKMIRCTDQGSSRLAGGGGSFSLRSCLNKLKLKFSEGPTNQMEDWISMWLLLNLNFFQTSQQKHQINPAPKVLCQLSPQGIKVHLQWWVDGARNEKISSDSKLSTAKQKRSEKVYVYIYICYIIFIYVSKWSLDTPAIQPPWEVTLSSSWQCHPTSGRPPSWWNWEATHKNHTQPISTNCPSSNKNQHLKDSTHFTCEFCCTTCYCESICLGIPDSSLHVLHASMWEYAGSYHAMEYHHWGYACHATDLLPNSSPGPIQRHSDYKNAETIWQWRTAPSRNSYKPPKRANWNQFHLPRLSVPLLLFSWSLNIDRVTWRKPFFLVPRAVLKFTKLAPSRTTHLTQKNITSLSRYSLKQHYQLNVVFFPWPFISTSHQSFPLQVTHLGRFRRFRCRRHLRCQRHRWTAWRLFSHRPAACWVAVSIEET